MIIEGISNSRPESAMKQRRRIKREPRTVTPVEPALVVPPPQVKVLPPEMKVLPPKLKKEYRPRLKRFVQEARALAAPVSTRPVFVPQSAGPVVAAAPAQPKEFNVASMEAVVRHNLLGGAA
ncbi:MAG TPA: hypothetical protein VM865_01075 [Acidobacteriaceae bacterium]|nr:hypothetical protein [Acidobacteriaceae bacterium]